MWSAAPSSVMPTTRPRTSTYSDGSSGFATLRATRGSRRMLATFWWPSTVLIRTLRPSVSTQVCVICGEPSDMRVARKHGLGCRSSSRRAGGMSMGSPYPVRRDSAALAQTPRRAIGGQQIEEGDRVERLGPQDAGALPYAGGQQLEGDDR